MLLILGEARKKRSRSDAELCDGQNRAGQGHLARTLAVSFGLDVIAIERDIGNVQRGEERAAQGANLAFVAANIEGPEDISKIVGDSDAVVVSLHACGTLSSLSFLFSPHHFCHSLFSLKSVGSAGVFHE